MTEALKLKNRPQKRWVSLFPVLTMLVALALWRFLPAPISEAFYPNCPGFILHPSLLIVGTRKTLVVLALSLAFMLMLPFVLRLTFRRQYGRWRAITVLLLMLSGGLITPLIGRYLDISGITHISSATYNGITYHIARSEKGNWLDYLVYKCDPAELICTYFSAGSAGQREKWFFPPEIRVTGDNHAVAVFRGDTLAYVLDELPHEAPLPARAKITLENAAQLEPLASIAVNGIHYDMIGMEGWSGDGQFVYISSMDAFDNHSELRRYNMSLQYQTNFLSGLIPVTAVPSYLHNNRGMNVFFDFRASNLYMVNTNDGRQKATRIPGAYLLAGASVSPDGSLLAGAQWEPAPPVPAAQQVLDVYSTITGQRVARWPIDEYCCMTISPDNRYVTVSQGSLQVWEIATQRLMYEKPELQNGSVHFSPDGRLFYVSDSHNLMLTVLDTPTGSVLHTMPLTGFTSVSFSPDGRLMLLKTSGLSTFLNARTFETAASFPARYEDSSFSPDGTLLATEAGSRVELWGVPAVEKHD